MPKRALPKSEPAVNLAAPSVSREMAKKKEVLKSKYVGVRAVKNGKHIATL